MSLFDSGIWGRGGRVAERNQEPEQDGKLTAATYTSALLDIILPSF